MIVHLFANNNRTVINRLAKRNYIANRRKNFFVIIALALTAFMISSIFSIGFSYYETYQLQQIRLMGTTADIAITSPSDIQMQQMEQSGLIANFGKSQRLGTVDTNQIEDSLLGLVWIDVNEWKTHRMPSVSGIHGTYPQEENEIMLPTWVLEKMGITAPQLKMTIPLSYQLDNSQYSTYDEFVLSGYYTDYIFSRTNNKGSVYVSQKFKEKTGIPFSVGGSAMVSFVDNEIVKNCEKISETINLTQNQEIEVVPSSETNNIAIVATIILLVFFIVFSGYLLIYNILYISVSKDVRFYGQLKTLGATKKQIKKIVWWQVLRTSIIGIPMGLLLGVIVSFGIVPYALKLLYSGNAEVGIKISFSPFIFIGAALFTLITAIVGNMKPAKLAGGTSPIAALQYIGVDNRTKITKKSHGIRLSRIALQNVFRNRKSAVLVFSSLFLGLCLYLVTTGLLSSISPENFVRQWGESDFALTYSIQEKEEPITEKMLYEIRQIEGVENLCLTYVAKQKATMDILYDENVFGDYLSSLDGKSGIDFSNPEKRSKYQQFFFSGVYGIDTAYVEELNQNLEIKIDVGRFENGELVLLCEMTDDNGNNIIQPDKKITVQGEREPQEFTVANGFLAADFQGGRGNERGTAPDLFISQNALKKLVSDCKIFRISFDIARENEKAVLKQLKVITASSPDVEIISRFEKKEEMSSYILTSRVLGMGLSVILLLIGIINFINTMVVSINARKKEFAVLESIGMTKKQIQKVLIYEGAYYCGISFTLLISLGNGFYILLYLGFQRLVPYALFQYPMIQLLYISVLVLLICIMVPIFTYKIDLKTSVVERLRRE